MNCLDEECKGSCPPCASEGIQHGHDPRLLGVGASGRNRRKFTTDVNDVPLLSYVHKQLGSLAQLCGKPTLRQSTVGSRVKFRLFVHAQGARDQGCSCRTETSSQSSTALMDRSTFNAAHRGFHETRSYGIFGVASSQQVVRQLNEAAWTCYDTWDHFKADENLIQGTAAPAVLSLLGDMCLCQE